MGKSDRLSPGTQRVSGEGNLAGRKEKALAETAALLVLSRLLAGYNTTSHKRDDIKTRIPAAFQGTVRGCKTTHRDKLAKPVIYNPPLPPIWKKPLRETD